MLSADDATIVQRDRSIAGLGVLLDADAFADTLRQVYPDAGVGAVQPRYVRYKAGMSCLVAYSVQSDVGAQTVYARAHHADVDDKMAKVGQRDSVATPLGPGIVVRPDEGLVIFAFPNDHELRALQALGAESARREMLACLLPEQPDARDGRVEPLRYKPERRFVGHLRTDHGHDAVLKFYTRDDYMEISVKGDRLVDAAPLRIAHRLHRSKQYRAAVIQWIEGRSLRDVIAGSMDLADDCTLVGAALAQLHVQKPKRMTSSWSAGEFARSLADAAAAVAEVAPTLAPRAQTLARRLGEIFVGRHWRARRAIHGDFSADQVLLQDGSAAFLDFDRAGYSDPRLDLGSFQARLALDVIAGQVTSHRAEAAFAALIDGYRRAAAKDVTRKLHRYTAGCILQCAIEPFRHRHDDWLDRIEAIIDRAEVFAERGPARV